MDYTEGARKRTSITRKLTFTGPRRAFLKSLSLSFYFFIERTRTMRTHYATQSQIACYSNKE